MKLLIHAILLMSITISGFAQYDNIKHNDKVPRTDSIRGDLNGDGIQDLLVVHYDGYTRTKMKLQIYFRNNTNKYALVLDRYFFEDGVVKPPLFAIRNGYILYQFAYMRSEIQYVYKYYPRLNDWYCYMAFLVSSEDESEGLFNEAPTYCGPMTSALGDTLNKNESITTEQEQNDTWNKLNFNYHIYLNEYKIKQYKHLSEIKENEIPEYLNIIGINDSSVQIINDIAFFLIEYAQILHPNDQNHFEKMNLAIVLLENIIHHYDQRTVAYINLGDAYWGLNEHDKAKQSYRTYIEQMKASGKEAKIPKRVWERVK